MTLLLLSACAFIGPEERQARRDQDGDGHIAVQFGGDDCDDHDAQINPGQAELCNQIDDDCDGTMDNVRAPEGILAYTDNDQDGWGDDTTAVQVCVLTSVQTLQAGDCADDDPSIHPLAEELCNGIDDDCDQALDDQDDSFTGGHYYPDQDGDGWGDGEVLDTPDCVAPAGYAPQAGDCDDDDPGINPDAQELCGGGDQDCDGLEDDLDPSTAPESLTAWYPDQDADGYGADSGVVHSCLPPAGYSAESSDCDDSDPWVHPGMLESCETEWDDDCDGNSKDCNHTRSSNDWRVKGSSAGAQAGASLALGDWDGDGILDLAVGSPEGATLSLLFGPAPASVGWTADLQLLGSSSSRLAAALDSRDADYDGISDLAIGAPGADEVLVLLGGGPLDLHAQDARMYGEDNPGFGSAVAWVEVGGSDLSLAVSAPEAEHGKPAVFLFADSTQGTTKSGDANAQIKADYDSPQLLGEVLVALDSDGDGEDELALSDRVDQHERYQVLVMSPWDSQLDASQADTKLSKGHARVNALATADWNGDGRTDLAIGSAGAKSGGEVYLFWGPLDHDLQFSQADASIKGSTAEGIGSSLCSHPDIDGDGKPELWVGGESQAWLFVGSLSAVTMTKQAAMSFSGSSDGTGSSIATGDLNADGHVELLLSAPHASSSAGAVSIFDGARIP